MVDLNKKLKFEALEEKEMTPESFSSISQIVASWILKEMSITSGNSVKNSLIATPHRYTINSKKD